MFQLTAQTVMKMTYRPHLAAYLTSCLQVTHSSLLLRPLGIRHIYTDTGHMFQLTAQTVMKMTITYPPAYFTSCIQVTHSSLLLRPWEIRPLHIQGTCFSSLSIMYHIPQITTPNMGKRASHIQLYKSCDPAHCTSCTEVSHPSSTMLRPLGRS